MMNRLRKLLKRLGSLFHRYIKGGTTTSGSGRREQTRKENVVAEKHDEIREVAELPSSVQVESNPQSHESSTHPKISESSAHESGDSSSSGGAKSAMHFDSPGSSSSSSDIYRIRDDTNIGQTEHQSSPSPADGSADSGGGGVALRLKTISKVVFGSLRVAGEQLGIIGSQSGGYDVDSVGHRLRSRRRDMMPSVVSTNAYDEILKRSIKIPMTKEMMKSLRGVSISEHIPFIFSRSEMKRMVTGLGALRQARRQSRRSTAASVLSMMKSFAGMISGGEWDREAYDTSAGSLMSSLSISKQSKRDAGLIEKFLSGGRLSRKESKGLASIFKSLGIKKASEKIAAVGKLVAKHGSGEAYSISDVFKRGGVAGQLPGAVRAGGLSHIPMVGVSGVPAAKHRRIARGGALTSRQGSRKRDTSSRQKKRAASGTKQLRDRERVAQKRDLFGDDINLIYRHYEPGNLADYNVGGLFRYGDVYAPILGQHYDIARPAVFGLGGGVQVQQPQDIMSVHRSLGTPSEAHRPYSSVGMIPRYDSTSYSGFNQPNKQMVMYNSIGAPPMINPESGADYSGGGVASRPPRGEVYISSKMSRTS